MLKTLINVFKIEELRNKILFTLGMLLVFRIGHWIPLPGVNQEKLQELFDNAAKSGSAFGAIANYVTMFSGGSLSQSTIFGLGIMPYITAGIIFQLLASFLPQLKAIQEEGPTGRQKIMEYTRYATVALCIVQGLGWLAYLTNSELIYPAWLDNPLWWVMAVSALTAGTVFLMWLGEQIDKHGIGSGASMIIMAGILANIPTAIRMVVANFSATGETGKMGWMGLITLSAGFVGVIAAAVLMQVAQRRIPVQQAKHTRGRKVYGGQKSYLPMRINHGGVMPIIFASSLMIFPVVIFTQLREWAQAAVTTGGGSQTLLSIARFLSDNFNHSAFLYILLYIAMIYFFSYFWITVQFNPEDMSKQLKEHGSFIPGLRPGPRTAEYLETVITRITFVGAAFLAIVAVLPTVVNSALNVDMVVTQFLGGTGLLIVVSVCMDFLQRVEANLMMRNYQGFLGGEDGGGGSTRLGGHAPR
jgi:preprotein translocase subunit SecY